jgi:hypothetical protein
MAASAPDRTPVVNEFSCRRLVILESPFAGRVAINVEYARACVRDSLARGEAPIASHLLYTQPGILRDDVPEERRSGIDAGLAWRTVAEASVVYEDLGVSPGMQYGIAAAAAAGLVIETRRIGWVPPAVCARPMPRQHFPTARAMWRSAFSFTPRRPRRAFEVSVLTDYVNLAIPEGGGRISQIVAYSKQPADPGIDRELREDSNLLTCLFQHGYTPGSALSFCAPNDNDRWLTVKGALLNHLVQEQQKILASLAPLWSPTP